MYPCIRNYNCFKATRKFHLATFLQFAAICVEFVTFFSPLLLLFLGKSSCYNMCAMVHCCRFHGIRVHLVWQHASSQKEWNSRRCIDCKIGTLVWTKNRRKEIAQKMYAKQEKTKWEIVHHLPLLKRKAAIETNNWQWALNMNAKDRLSFYVFVCLVLCETWNVQNLPNECVHCTYLFWRAAREGHFSNNNTARCRLSSFAILAMPLFANNEKIHADERREKKLCVYTSFGKWKCESLFDTFYRWRIERKMRWWWIKWMTHTQKNEK